jgi:hypothetical protein
MTVAINKWTCTSASGMFTEPTKAVTSCYFQDSAGNHYPAAAINNNNPNWGDWSASNFPVLQKGSYTLVAEGDDDSRNSVGPFQC